MFYINWTPAHFHAHSSAAVACDVTTRIVLRASPRAVLEFRYVAVGALARAGRTADTIRGNLRCTTIVGLRLGVSILMGERSCGQGGCLENKGFLRRPVETKSDLSGS